MAPAAARTPAPLATAVQHPPHTALVLTDTRYQSKKDTAATPKRSVPARRHLPLPAQQAPATTDHPQTTRHDQRPHADPQHGVSHRQRTQARHWSAPRTAPRKQTPRPTSTYSLRTVCSWSHQAPVAPSVRQLCDTYVP
ncbi:hypothetical protein [Streptomyces sasae]|uniref:hypothetical protein n=1 Tax=Streptomyces sasae TaxID=1266772 RepID=UPI002930ED89|nr:hypothetical protein [Streptomyces sasae]